MRDHVLGIGARQPIEPTQVPDIVKKRARPAFQAGFVEVKPAARRLAVETGDWRNHEGLGCACLGRLSSDDVRIIAQLSYRGAVIAHQPFGMDAVILADAIGDKADRSPTICARSPRSPPDICRATVAEMRCVEARFLVTAPGDRQVMNLAVRIGIQGGYGRGNHLLNRANDPVGRIDGAARVVGIVNIAYRPIHPDFVGDAHDIVDDIGKSVFETFHGLSALARSPTKRAWILLAQERHLGSHR